MANGARSAGGCAATSIAAARGAAADQGPGDAVGRRQAGIADARGAGRTAAVVAGGAAGCRLNQCQRSTSAHRATDGVHQTAVSAGAAAGAAQAGPADPADLERVGGRRRGPHRRRRRADAAAGAA